MISKDRGKIIPFPEHNQQCISCNENVAMHGMKVCESCSKAAIDSLDEQLTQTLMSCAVFIPKDAMERLLVQQLCSIQKGEYHDFWNDKG